MEAILAGIYISIGAIVYLKVGGIVGACLFAVGLMSVLYTGAHLFTGKARLLAYKHITPLELAKIWCGNAIGTMLIAGLVASTPLGAAISAPAAAIIAIRMSNSFITNIIMGIGCGILMTTAIEGTQTTENWLFAIIPVAAFIMIGFNHCVADMFYMGLVGAIKAIPALLATTIGNVIGCCLAPLGFILSERNSKEPQTKQNPIGFCNEDKEEE